MYIQVARWVPNVHFNTPGDKEAHSNETKETGRKTGRKIGFVAVWDT